MAEERSKTNTEGPRGGRSSAPAKGLNPLFMGIIIGQKLL